jgi:hypothetical protein
LRFERVPTTVPSVSDNDLHAKAYVVKYISSLAFVAGQEHEIDSEEVTGGVPGEFAGRPSETKNPAKVLGRRRGRPTTELRGAVPDSTLLASAEIQVAETPPAQ